jgi:hypothetical protein
MPRHDQGRLNSVGMHCVFSSARSAQWLGSCAVDLPWPACNVSVERDRRGLQRRRRRHVRLEPPCQKTDSRAATFEPDFFFDSRVRRVKDAALGVKTENRWLLSHQVPLESNPCQTERQPPKRLRTGWQLERCSGMLPRLRAAATALWAHLRRASPSAALYTRKTRHGPAALPKPRLPTAPPFSASV